MFVWFLASAAAGLGMGSAAVVLICWVLRRRAMDRWIVPYVLQMRRRYAPRAEEDVHLLLCFADHFEPKADRATADRSRARVHRWVTDFPRQFARFRDTDGRPPRYTFFYPIEEYEPEYLDELAGLCREGFGEVEIHLHHHNDTSANLRASLLAFKELLHTRHGLLSCHRATGEVRYGFIHGNWALNNSLPGGRFCGVNDELEILRETGCYADFTLPSAPSLAQTSTINSIYYVDTSRHWPKSHNRGVAAGSGKAPASALLLIQGPLILDWSRRKHGLLPTVENGCLQASQPPDIARLPLWLGARVQIPQRPDWFFVKLHAHGAEEHSHHTLLGEPMVNFHKQLAEYARANPHFHFHYVTAREMYNLVRAAEAGFKGNVAAALDYELIWPLKDSGRFESAAAASVRTS
jgi:hypothetical protein